MNIVIHSNRKNTGSDLSDFISAMNLRYLASDLKHYGFQNKQELQRAIVRASQAIEANGLDLRSHVRPVYTSLNGMLQEDWRLSKVAMKLVVLNGNPNYLAVAKIQWELVKES